MSGYVIARGDGLAVMDGSRACAVLWGKDPEQVRVYEHLGLAEASLLLFADGDSTAYLAGADFWKTAQRLLTLLEDGCFRAHDDLEEDLPGLDYCDVLEALVDVGKVSAVDHEEYGVVYFREDVKPSAEAMARCV